MRFFKSILMAVLLLVTASAFAQEKGEDMDMKSYIFGHVGDSYECTLLR